MVGTMWAGGAPCEIDIKLAKIPGRKPITLKDRNGGVYKAPVYLVSHISPKNHHLSW
jgi:vacuolar protein sorting-associated protein 26